jgi:hypothetical protein
MSSVIRLADGEAGRDRGRRSVYDLEVGGGGVQRHGGNGDQQEQCARADGALLRHNRVREVRMALLEADVALPWSRISSTRSSSGRSARKSSPPSTRAGVRQDRARGTGARHGRGQRGAQPVACKPPAVMLMAGCRVRARPPRWPSWPVTSRSGRRKKVAGGQRRRLPSGAIKQLEPCRRGRWTSSPSDATQKPEDIAARAVATRRRSSPTCCWSTPPVVSPSTKP